jgi:hypothetical protein
LVDHCLSVCRRAEVDAARWHGADDADGNLTMEREAAIRVNAGEALHARRISYRDRLPSRTRRGRGGSDRSSAHSRTHL